MEWRRVYVGVRAEVDSDGRITPQMITWEDGREFEVDRILDVCKAYSQRVGGTGMCYTVRILGKEVRLYNDDGHWFMEGKDKK